MNREFIVDSIGPGEWEQSARTFDHYNLYQTASYASFHSPASSTRGVIRCCALREGRPVVMGQFRVKKIPGFGWGAAEMEWGPLWRVNDGEEAEQDCLFFLREARTRIGDVAKLEMRLFPHTTHPFDCDSLQQSLIEEAGFRLEVTETRNYDTVMIDLSKDAETLRGELHPKWRNLLKKAEKSGFEIETGRTVELFDRFASLYEAMRTMKSFATGVRLPVIRKMQAEAPEADRFWIAIATREGRDAAAAVCAVTGTRMLYFLGASHPDHREGSPGHLLQWEMMRLGRETGVRWYDLGGLVDEGVSRFKSRMGGEPIAFPRPFIYRPSALRSLGFRWAEKALGWLRG